QRFIASGWVRGAVSGIGILNLGMGVWELFNFRKTVRALDAGLPSVKSSPEKKPQPVTTHGAAVPQTDPLSDYPRRKQAIDDFKGSLVRIDLYASFGRGRRSVCCNLNSII